jgi:capsular exopolysaccharide synthesis family protein
MSSTPLPVPALAGPPVASSGKFKPIDPLRLLRQHLKLFVLVGFVGIFVGVGLWFALRETVPRYASSAQLRATEGTANLDEVNIGGVSNVMVAAMEAFIQSEVYKIQSEELLGRALNNPTVRASEWFSQYESNKQPGTYDFIRARQDLVDDHLRVSMIRNTQLINLVVTTPQKDDCQKIAKAIVDVYLGRIKTDTDNQVGSQRNSLITEQNRFDRQIANLTTEIEEFTREHDLTNIEGRLDEAAIDRQLRIDKRAELQFLLAEYQKGYDAALEQQAAGGAPSASASAGAAQNEAIQIRDERLRSLREQREVALHDFGEGHRYARAIDRQITATEAERERELERLIRENEQAMISGYKQQIESLTEQILEYDEQIAELRQQLIDLNVHQTKFNNLQTQLDEAKAQRVTIDNQLSEVRLIENMPDARPVQLQANPSLPEMVFPKIEVIVPATMFVLLLVTGGFVFLRELMDQSIKSPADVKLLKEAELLGLVPHADEDPSGPSEVERVVEKYPSGLLAEAYRQVRTAILGKMDRRGYKTLLIASAQPDAGASSLTHNLATSLAFNGRKVAIVDANFRRPSQHQFVDADNDRGMVDILLHGASLDDMLLTMHDPDLSVLPTGRATDAQPELLEGAKFRSLIGDLETRFDVVLIDAPPALLSSECQVLTKHVDAVAAVVRAGTDKRGMIDRMAGQFAGQRADMLGIVLNGVQSSVGGYFRASFRDFYRYRENGEPNGKANGRRRRRDSVDIPETADTE